MRIERAHNLYPVFIWRSGKEFQLQVAHSEACHTSIVSILVADWTTSDLLFSEESSNLYNGEHLYMSCWNLFDAFGVDISFHKTMIDCVQNATRGAGEVLV